MKRRRNKKQSFLKVLLTPKGLMVTLATICVFSGILVYAASSKDISDKVVNRLTIPHLEGRIEETFDADAAVGTKNETEKKVVIKNTGNTNLFVRVLVLAEIENAEGIQIPANVRKTNTAGKTTGQIELVDWDKTVWLDGEDDYLYYSKKVKIGETSEPLFKGVKINGSTLTADVNPANDKEVYYFSYDKSKLKITIKEETVTSIGDSYQSVWNLKNASGAFLSDAYKEIDQKLQVEKE